MSLEIVAILHPAAGKADRVIELMSQVAKHVEGKEPGTLKYEIVKQTSGDAPKVLVLEKYKDAAALGAHGKFPEFREINKQLGKEKLLDGKTEIYIVSKVAGVSRL